MYTTYVHKTDVALLPTNSEFFWTEIHNVIQIHI